jgi:superfamily II DNA or RNA helicase
VTEIKLRDYQREAIDAVFAAWDGGMKRPAIVLPTGAGKTVVFSALVKEFRAKARPRPGWERMPKSGSRVLILAHRDELVDQAIAKVRATMPGIDVGKVKAKDNDVDAEVMVCSVQTLATAKRREYLMKMQYSHGQIGLIITDECHHAAAASYQKIYDAFPDALQLGVTATMARGDGVGLGKIWDDVVYSRSILNLISKGHLTDVRTKQVDLKALDLGAVKASRGDWQAGDLGKAMMDAQADTAIARAYREHAGDRQGIVFTPTVETAYAACDALNAAYIKASPISGESTRDERQLAYEQFRTGKVQVLVNCMVLTEGFDAPWAEVAVIARPTQSAPLYTQMVGRVLRPWPGKKEALVLDLVGASANRLRTLIDLEPGQVQAVRDGESLAEAVIREEEDQGKKVPAGSLAFELKARDVSSFATSDHAWIRTPAGVLFIRCGDTLIYLAPEKGSDGLWGVRLARRGGRGWSYERTPHTGLQLGEAMAWGEAVAEDHEGQGMFGFNARRSARWRTTKPSPTQIAYATRLGIPADQAGAMRKGELSEAIDQRVGASVFDRHVKG